MSKPDYDLCIIGGGINGTGIARDAAGRGLSVLLVEANDLASATSAASTKLIHGGLRYLEHYEFGMVRSALNEREVLLKQAPHIIKPMTFILPYAQELRPAWMIRIGLYLYDYLGGRKKLAASKGYDLSTHDYGLPLKDRYQKGFSYADCWVDDARLVILNAMDAKEHGADIMTRTSCSGLIAGKNHWTVNLTDTNTGKNSQKTAKKIVNAAGPWVRKLLENSFLADLETPKARLVKGSHIITKELFKGNQAYILQQPDNRIIFAIPYESDFTLIGTTDVDYDEDPAETQITEQEIQYLCEAINRSFKKQISQKDVVWSYSGVRPLLDDGKDKASKVTRDYRLQHDKHKGQEILSVFGGKITTYRKLAQQVVNLLCDAPTWTKKHPLPGGQIADADFGAFLHMQKRYYPWLPENTLYRLARCYGSRINQILDEAKSPEDLGQHFGDGLYEAEISYLIDNEWARTAEDILWRRTKMGLHVSQQTIDNLLSSNILPNAEDTVIRTFQTGK